MTSQDLTQKIILKLIRYKWLLLLVSFIAAAGMYLLAKSKPVKYTAIATVYPLTGANENPTSSAITTLLGGSDAPKSFSQDASINIVELALSRNTTEYVAMQRLPAFKNKRVAELLIESYNESRSPFSNKIEPTTDTSALRIIGSALLKQSYNAKFLKSGILEVSFTNTNSKILSPISYELINKLSQFYIDLKIRKAQKDFDFTVKKIDSLQQVLNGYDRRAIAMNRGTMFTPGSRMEYSIPKENLVNAKERVARQRDAALNNREEALWRLQKATPIIATLDKPEPPFDESAPSAISYALIGLISGFIICSLIILIPLLTQYAKYETTKIVFGGEASAGNTTTTAS